MIKELYESGLNQKEISEILGGGISIIVINRILRAIYAYSQMEEDEEYGEEANPRIYSYFEELMRRPYLRDTWLGWDEDSMRFTKLNELKKFYSWISPSEDLNGEKKVPMAIKVRNLVDIMQDNEIYNYFLEPDVDIDEALAKLRVKQQSTVRVDWRSELIRIADFIQNKIPIMDIQKEDLELLKSLQSAIEELVRRIERILAE